MVFRFRSFRGGEFFRRECLEFHRIHASVGGHIDELVRQRRIAIVVHARLSDHEAWIPRSNASTGDDEGSAHVMSGSDPTTCAPAEYWEI